MNIEIDLTSAVIQTERLILRPWLNSDLNDFFEYACVEGVGEMAGWPHHKDIEETRKILNMFIAEKNVLAVVFKENGKVIGSVGLHESWANEDEGFKHLSSKDVGYVLSKEYWGKGLMPEAVTALIRFTFESLPLSALTCEHFEQNAQSRRVIEKCGFNFVKDGSYNASQLQKQFADKKYILISKA